MSHPDDSHEQPVVHHDPAEGFDRTEPHAGAIAAFGVVSVLMLVLLIFAVQGYFDKVYQEAVFEKVLSAPSQQLQDLRDRDAWNLTHYMYGDLSKTSGRVRIPIDRALELYAQEAAAGKLFYPAKATAPKKDDYMQPLTAEQLNAPPAPAAAPAAGAAPEAPAKKE
jgi:hypothetical protein